MDDIEEEKKRKIKEKKALVLIKNKIIPGE